MSELTDIKVVAQGQLFDVTRASLAGEPVYIKRASLQGGAGRATRLGSAWTHSNETNVFHTRGMGWEPTDGEPRRRDIDALLAAEHAVIERVGPAWNHPGTALMRWNGGELTPERDCSETAAGDLCIVMDEARGTSVADMPRELQRQWLPKMLPALWQALAHCPHGDLELHDLVVDPTGSFFRILDPGVRIPGPTRGREGIGGLDFNSELFTTNAANYPLIEPEHGPGRPRIKATFSALPGLLEMLSGSLFEAVGSQALSAAVGSSPAASDCVAIGTIYFEVLTGTSLSAALGLESPAWSGFWSDTGDSPDLSEPIAALKRDAVGDALRSSPGRPSEAALCDALVNLRIDSDDQLVAMVREATVDVPQETPRC